MISCFIQILLYDLICICADIKQTLPKHQGSISGYFENHKKLFTPQDKIYVFLESPLTLLTLHVADFHSDVTNSTSTESPEASYNISVITTIDHTDILYCITRVENDNNIYEVLPSSHIADIKSLPISFS